MLQTWKNAFKKHPDFSFIRELEAGNYPTLTFYYREVGRFQWRFQKDGSYELWLPQRIASNSSRFFERREGGRIKVVFEWLIWTLDLYIDNDEQLYNRAVEPKG